MLHFRFELLAAFHVSSPCPSRRAVAASKMPFDFVTLRLLKDVISEQPSGHPSEEGRTIPLTNFFPSGWKYTSLAAMSLPDAALYIASGQKTPSFFRAYVQANWLRI